MPRFAAPPRQEESRQALEQRARQAAMPTLVEKKRKWPFPVANEEAGGDTDKDREQLARRDEFQLE